MVTFMFEEMVRFKFICLIFNSVPIVSKVAPVTMNQCSQLLEVSQ